MNSTVFDDSKEDIANVMMSINLPSPLCGYCVVCPAMLSAVWRDKEIWLVAHHKIFCYIPSHFQSFITPPPPHPTPIPIPSLTPNKEGKIKQNKKWWTKEMQATNCMPTPWQALPSFMQTATTTQNTDWNTREIWADGQTKTETKEKELNYEWFNAY